MDSPILVQYTEGVLKGQTYSGHSQGLTSCVEQCCTRQDPKMSLHPS